MSKEFLSYMQEHFQIQYLGITHLNRFSEETQIWFERLGRNTCRLKLQIWVLDTIPCFEHVLNAFNESIEYLDRGKMDLSYNSLPDHLEDQITKKYRDSFCLAINRFPLLKSVELRKSNITTVAQNDLQRFNIQLS